MLCLTRREKDVVVIKLPNGERIEMVISKIQDEKVIVGFKCGKDIIIVRKEIEHKEN